MKASFTREEINKERLRNPSSCTNERGQVKELLNRGKKSQRGAGKARSQQIGQQMNAHRPAHDATGVDSGDERFSVPPEGRGFLAREPLVWITCSAKKRANHGEAKTANSEIG